MENGNAPATINKLLNDGDIDTDAAVKALLAGQIYIINKLGRLDQLEDEMAIVKKVGATITGIVLVLLGAWLKSVLGI